MDKLRLNKVIKKRKVFAADLFCGAGGTSTGLIRACEKMGIDIELLAVNHWDTAIATHSKNHPNVKHLCMAIDKIRPTEAVPGGRLHLLVASPECTHHSRARGGKPMNDQSRATAWDILRWADRLIIDNILIENVPEFEQWGPLGKNGLPMKSKKGHTFLAFVEALRKMGYRVEWKVLNAADFGDATTRERLFVIARRSNKKIVWPTPSHAQVGKTDTLFGEKLSWRPAREIIDWSLEGKSIWDRKKPLADATLKRIEAGLRKFGGKNAEPFLVILRNNQTAQSIDQPVPTITTSGAHMALCEPFVLGQQSGSAPRSVGAPIPTIATDGAIGLVQPFVVTVDRPETNRSLARSVDDPLPTVTGSPRIGVVEPYLVRFQGNREADLKRNQDLDTPLGTLDCSNRYGLVEPFIMVNRTNNTAKSVDDPVPTLCTGNHMALVEPFIVPQFSESVPKSVEDPLGTITTTSRGIGLCQPFLLPHPRPDDMTVDSLEKPMRTITGTSSDFALVQPFIVPHFGERDGQSPRTHSVDHPLPTVTSHGAGALVEPHLIEFYGNGQARSVDDPLPTVTTKDRFGLVTIDGTQYKLDIRFRMLQPHELAAAMGFPKEYQFAGNREAVVKQIGNAVPGHLSEALTSVLLAA